MRAFHSLCLPHNILTCSRIQIGGVDVFPSTVQVCNLPESYHERQDQIAEYVRAHGYYPEPAGNTQFGRDGLVNPTAQELQTPPPVEAVAPPADGAVSEGSEGSFWRFPAAPFVRRASAREAANPSVIDLSQASASSSGTSEDDIHVVTSRRRTGMSSSAPTATRRPQRRQRQRRVPASRQQQSEPTPTSPLARAPSAVARAQPTSQASTDIPGCAPPRHRASNRISNFIGDPHGENALLWILEAAERAGWDVSLAYGVRGSFLQRLLPGLFSAQSQGPLAGYRQFQVNQLMRKLKAAEDYCRRKYYDQQGAHSADATGADGETIPRYASLFRQYFYWEEDHKSPSASTEAARQERLNVERSITGQMAPLGEPGQGLRTERSSNNESRSFSASRDLGQDTEVTVMEVDSSGRTSNRRSNVQQGQQRTRTRGQGQGGRRRQQASRASTRLISRQNIENLMRENNLLGTRAREIREQFSQLTTGLYNVLQFPTVPIRPFGEILADISNVELRRDQALRNGNDSQVAIEEQYLVILQNEVNAYQAAQQRSLRQFQNEQAAHERAGGDNDGSARNDNDGSARNENGNNEESKDSDGNGSGD